jgi:hypothetical protein
METNLLTRILIGAVSVAFLVGYVAWRWRRAGQVLASGEAFGEQMNTYFLAMRADPRWLQLQALIQQRYALAEPGANPEAFAVQHVALVDDRGQIYAQHTSPGPTRVVALLTRSQPAQQLYVSMGLADGAVREDPAPYGWTYTGPPR